MAQSDAIKEIYPKQQRNLLGLIGTNPGAGMQNIAGDQLAFDSQRLLKHLGRDPKTMERVWSDEEMSPASPVIGQSYSRCIA